MKKYVLVLAVGLLGTAAVTATVLSVVLPRPVGLGGLVAAVEERDRPLVGGLPAALAAEAVIMVEPAAEDRDVHFELHDHPALYAAAEERAVIQILVNLMGNAVRYSKRGGRATIRFSSTGGTVSLSVCDEGKGIDPTDQERIFERFERADETGGGTGLGLAISRRLARSMGGDISLESKPGEGATFTLTLPAA